MLLDGGAQIVVYRDVKLLYLIGLALGYGDAYVGKLCKSSARVSCKTYYGNAKSLSHL